MTHDYVPGISHRRMREKHPHAAILRTNRDGSSSAFDTTFDAIRRWEEINGRPAGIFNGRPAGIFS
jgi:hypothetical protein